MSRKIMMALAGAILLAGCATAPKAPVEPHPDTPAYNWKPLFAKDLSDAELEKGAWRWEGDVLRSVLDKPIWTKADYENYVLDFEYMMEKLQAAFPEQKMYAMRFVEDYMEYDEAYLESAGLIDWE